MSNEHAPNGSTGTNGNGVSQSPEWERLQRLALTAGGVGIAIFAVIGLIEGAQQFFTSYLAAWTFWLALPIGSMALIAISLITGASWGVLLRAPLEACTRTFPLLVALAVPLIACVFLGSTSPYHWSQDPESLTDSPSQIQELKEKFERFMNAPGFTLRMLIYFAVWGTLIFLQNKWNRQVELTDDRKARRFVENFAGPLMMLFCIGNMIACSDIVMSVETSWASTMFPLIYCMNQLQTSFCFAVAIFLTLSTQAPLKNILRPKFQIDMGSFMLAITLVWCYMNYSQYMLIWIGNLPEEIVYFAKRQNGGWEYLAYFQCIFHFALPFILLLYRDVKLHPVRLRAMAIMIMIFCALDTLWWIEPNRPHKGVLFLVMDVAAYVGIGGIWGWVFLGQFKKYPLLPTNYLGQLPGGHHAH